MYKEKRLTVEVISTEGKRLIFRFPHQDEKGKNKEQISALRKAGFKVVKQWLSYA